MGVDLWVEVFQELEQREEIVQPSIVVNILSCEVLLVKSGVL